MKTNTDIFQNRHTGLFGFLYVNGCPDLSKAIYKTKRSAVINYHKYRVIKDCMDKNDKQQTKRNKKNGTK